MKAHKCMPAKYCFCNSSALEPADDCPIHGHNFTPPQCITCGKFLKRDQIIIDEDALKETE